MAIDVQGRKVFAQMKTDYEQGMIVLNKNNIVKTLYREWATRLAPLRPPVDRMLLWIIQTGKYAPAAAWVITGQGYGLSYPQFDALWHIVLDPDGTTLEDVHRLFFYQRGAMAHGITERSLSSEWNISYEQAMDRARERREADYQAAATVDTVRRDMTSELVFWVTAITTPWAMTPRHHLPPILQRRVLLGSLYLMACPVMASCQLLLMSSSRQCLASLRAICIGWC